MTLEFTPRHRCVVLDAIPALLLAACASPGLPPGGPERNIPPVVTRIQPDTNSVGVRGNDFVIHFDEVVAERPARGSNLSNIVLISPRAGIPVVDWHRSSISIHPEDGWRRNTAYTVTLLPGLADLRGNVLTTATSATFSTGPSIPATSVRGTLFDWTSGAPIAAGIVEARSESDTSLVYVAASDSTGRFSMRGMPVASYQIVAYPDQNNDGHRNTGDIFDSTRVYVADSVTMELLAFAHDSVGPQLAGVTIRDSVTLRAIFGTALDPRVPFDTSNFALFTADSSRVRIVSVAVSHDDTVPAAPPPPPIPQSAVPIPRRRPAKPVVVLPKPIRPLLIRNVTVVLAAPLVPGASYRLAATDVTGPTGSKASSDATFTVPKPAPLDETPASTPADTAHAVTSKSGRR